MGAVQKLATVVIIGLVALATALVVYLADEPNRRESQAGEQNQLAIERGTELYITYCLQCHGPAGLGSSEIAGENPRRVGGVLNQAYSNPDPAKFAVYQSDNPAEQQEAEAFIRHRLLNGYPEDPRITSKVMPSFSQELNVEEINDLVYLIMNGDWDYVYNQSVLHTGETVAQAECDATPPSESAEENAEQCERVEHPEPIYPTVPATPVPDEETASAAGSAGAETGGAADPSASGGGAGTPAAEGNANAPAPAQNLVLEALDPADWSVPEITVSPGDTIQAVNAGLSQHDFTVDELGIAQVLTAEPVEITIPEDAQPGEYEFYCSVPGHKELGMVGTLIIQ